MTTSPEARSRPAPTEIRLVVWQFVRVMVQLEAASRARGRQGAPTLYGAWRPAWQEIDRRLTEVGKTDANAFSELMMEQEVVLQCRTRTQIGELLRTLENVVNQLKAEIKAASGDARRLTDLRFERTELETLSRRLRKLSRSGASSAPRAKTKPTAGSKSTLRPKGAARPKSTGKPKPKGAAKSKTGSAKAKPKAKPKGRRPAAR
ncbi:MAG: hypothetical protein HKN28_12980 [Alphaproteobacteria bacterium]|nr:hypothetical protein [Alphaproteobacteria bacterium]